jgi:hypothetical protein
VIALPLTVQQHSDGTIKHPRQVGFVVLSSSMPERRAIPFALLGLLSLLAVAAAVVGIRVESSTGQLALEAAFQKTSEAASFSYVISGTAVRPESEQSRNFLAWGAWQSPDRLRLGSGPSPSKEFLVIIKSTLYLDNGRIARFRFTPALLDPFDTSGGNFSYPHGLPNSTGILLHKAAWRLSDFGLVPPVVAPSVNQ